MTTNGTTAAVATSGTTARTPAARNVTIQRTRMRKTTFNPHDTKGTVRVMQPTPKVAFTQEALDKMGAYVGLMDREIGWLSTVERDGAHFLVTDCYLFGQAVHATTTEIDPEKLAELIHEILQQDPENGVEIVNSMKCWGHSHVNMGTSPSGQDDRQMEDFGKTVDDYMIRVIANKRGHVRVDVWDYENGLIFEDLPWTVAEEEDTDTLNAVADEIEDKVTHLGSSFAGYSYGGQSSYAGGTAFAGSPATPSTGTAQRPRQLPFMDEDDPQDAGANTSSGADWGDPDEPYGDMLFDPRSLTLAEAESLGIPTDMFLEAAAAEASLAGESFWDTDETEADDGSYDPARSRRARGV